MTNRSDITPPVRRKMPPSNKNISELSEEFSEAFDSAPLLANRGNSERQAEAVATKRDLLSESPNFSAKDFVSKTTDVEDVFSESAPRKSPFMLYLNQFEKAAIALVMDAYGIASMNDLIREYGVYRAVDVAIEKLGFTEKVCEEFYKNNKHQQFAKKQSRTKRKG